MTPKLRDTLRAIGSAMADARSPWWVIGGAAAALHGVVGAVGDVDLMIGEADARVLAGRIGMTLSPGMPNDLFRSALFGQWRTLPLVVEIMAGFESRGGAGWASVTFASRERIEIDEVALFVPAAADLAAMLRRFGRDKDVIRADALDQLKPSWPGPKAWGSSSDRR